MKSKKIANIATLVLCISLFVSTTKAQNLKGDTIKLSESVFPVIIFPDSIQDVTVSCNKEDYLFQYDNAKLKLKAGVEKPASPCSMLVTEGNSKTRYHQFYLIFEPGTTADAFHDYSSLDLIKERIAALNAMKKATAPVVTASPTPAPQPASTENGTVAINSNPTPAGGPSTPDNAGAPLTSASDPNSITVDGLTIKMADIQQKVTAKLDLLQKYINLLGDKSTPNKNSIIDNAFALFNNDTSRRVEVKNNNGISSKPVKVYLKNLANLPYSKVEVKIKDIQFISKLVKQPNGDYEGYVTFIQEFTGRKGEHVYTSTQQKSQQVIIKIWSELKNGEEMKKWELFLGSISIADNK